jgi:plasmid stabilization system protein ParE
LTSLNNIYKKLNLGFDNLVEFPKFGKVCEENKNFRELSCENYIIYYKIEIQYIVIHRIIDSRVNFRK